LITAPNYYNLAGECLAAPDPVGHRVLRFGYINYYGNDSLQIHAYSPGVDSTWSRIIPAGVSPKAFAGSTAVYDSDHNRVLYYGGYPVSSGYDLNGLVYALSLGALPLAVPSYGGSGANAVMLATYPNPGRGRLRLKLATQATGPARVDVVDVAGRTIFARDLGTLAEGEHDLDLGPVILAPGLYFVTYVGNGRRVSVRTVVMQ
jgi:hypothetical protein